MTKALPCINTQQTAAKAISKVQQTLGLLSELNVKQGCTYVKRIKP